AADARRAFDGVHDDRVRYRAGQVVVLGLLVGRRGDHGHAVVVGVVDRLPGEHRAVVGAERLLHDAHAAIGAVDRRLREAVGVGHERLAHAQRHDHAVGARTHLAVAVVRFRGGVFDLTGAVPV